MRCDLFASFFLEFVHFSLQLIRVFAVFDPDEHRSGAGSVIRFGLERWVGDTHQHDVVFSHSGGGDPRGEENVEEDITEVCICSDQQLGFVVVGWLEMQHTHSFLYIGSVLLVE